MLTSAEIKIATNGLEENLINIIGFGFTQNVHLTCIISLVCGCLSIKELFLILFKSIYGTLFSLQLLKWFSFPVPDLTLAFF